jgi:hypothetical protein
MDAYQTMCGGKCFCGTMKSSHPGLALAKGENIRDISEIGDLMGMSDYLQSSLYMRYIVRRLCLGIAVDLQQNLCLGTVSVCEITCWRAPHMHPGASFLGLAIKTKGFSCLTQLTDAPSLCLRQSDKEGGGQVVRADIEVCPSPNFFLVIGYVLGGDSEKLA